MEGTTLIPDNGIRARWYRNKDVKARAGVILKDYVRQMKAAGFTENQIGYKLQEGGGIFVPDQLPANFGQPWAEGMWEEFETAKAISLGKNIKDMDFDDMMETVPSPKEYQEYKPGRIANRLPSYKEYSQRGYNTGGFIGNKNQNLNAALQKYDASYEGPRVGESKEGGEAGIVGLPLDIGQQYLQEFLKIAEGKAEEGRKTEEAKELYERILLNYPALSGYVKPNDTIEQMTVKINDYEEYQAAQVKPNEASVKSEIAQLFQEGKLDVESARQYAWDRGIDLDRDELIDMYDDYFPSGE